jgi:tetratricopeptide (TPR) repeat protein
MRTLGNTKKAKELAEDCLQRATHYQMGAWRAHPLHLLSWLSRDQGLFDQALDYLLKALEIHQNTDEHDQVLMLAQTHYDIAKLHILKRDFTEAEKHIQEASYWAKQISSQEISLAEAKLYGELYMARGDLDLALPYCLVAQDLAESRGDQRTVANLCFNLSQIYIRQGNLSKAIYYTWWGFSQLYHLGLINSNRFKATFSQLIKRRLPIA